jgi:hypothetical protein
MSLLLMHDREQQVLAIFHPLDKYLAQTKPDLMVVDFATWGAWDAAEKHKVSGAA